MSSPTTCQILPHERGDGPRNMATDEAMLGLVTDSGKLALFRTYEWAPPTLSLGYFQRAAAADDDPRWRDAPLVRRPTGGGAIWHDREVTYALAVPSGHPLARDPRTLYQAVHSAISGAFAALGPVLRRRGEASPASEDGARPLLCFLDRDDDDLVAGVVKLVGSSQRRRAGGFLQHGSVLLRRSDRTPELPGLLDLFGGSIDARSVARLLRERIPTALGLAPVEVDWPPELIQTANRLEREVYRSDRWTRKR